MSSQISNNERFKLTQPGASRKRKDGDRLDASQAHMPTKAEPAVLAAPLSARPQPTQPAAGGGNRLLAGYLAHEFVTKGTLFGKRWGLSAAAARPAARARHQQEAKEPIKQEQPTALETELGKPPMAYVEVAHLLKTEGAHIPGVVNPTQLARWLQLRDNGGAPNSESAPTRWNELQSRLCFAREAPDRRHDVAGTDW